MQLQKMAQCAIDLDFEPLHPFCANLPPMVWRGQRLTHFESPLGPEGLNLDSSQWGLDLSGTGKEFGVVLMDLYPRLGLGETVRLRVQLKKLNWQKELQSLNVVLAKGFADWTRVLDKLELAPEEFLRWLDQKQVRARELQILLEADLSKLSVALRAVTEVQCSHGTGVKLIELMAELSLMNREIPMPDSTSSGGDDWFQKMWKARHPLTTSRDERRRQIVQSLAWPAHVQADWIRAGDEGRLEIRFSAASGLEWQKRLSALAQLLEPVQNTVELWKNS